MTEPSIAQWNNQLEEYRERMAISKQLERQKKQKQARLHQEMKHVIELEVQLDREQEDVEKLLKLSWSNLFHTLLRSKEEQLELERQEALTVSLKLQQAKQEVVDLKLEIQETEDKLSLVGGAELEYTRLLALKEQWIREGDTSASQRLSQLDEQLAAQQLLGKEWREAANACSALVSALARAEDKLGSAANWGTYDMLGGGIISTSIKHSRIDEAKDAIYEARHLLNRLMAELKDVDHASDLTIDISGMEKFADYFFDGLLTDWIVQGKIKASHERVKQQLDQANKLHRQLESTSAATDRLQDELKRERGALIEQFGKYDES